MKNLLAFIFFLFLALEASSQQGAEFNTLLSREHKGPLLVGHRGGFDAKLPENSISNFDFTFKNACQAPVAIEFDIRESASGSLYIMHDTTVDRTTNGKGKVTGLTDVYIETLFLRDRNGILTHEKIPLFADVLHFFKDKNIVLMLDVKGKIYGKVISLVKQMDMEAKCILLTFSNQNTQLASSLTNKIMISALVGNKQEWESIREIRVPTTQLIAYVNENTPEEIILDINRNKVLLMTDMSESIRNNSKHYDADYYKNFILNKHLGILISDYPIYVGKLFCKE